MAITTQLIGALAAGGSITAVTVPRDYNKTFTWGEAGKTYIVTTVDGILLTPYSTGITASASGSSTLVLPGPLSFRNTGGTYLCIEVATGLAR